KRRPRCPPPPEEPEVLAIGRSVSAYPSEPSRLGKGEATTHAATLLVELADEAQLFHTSEGKCFATFKVGNNSETWEVSSRKFRLWLARGFYERQHRAPSPATMQAALTVLEGKALHEGPELPVHTRVAEREGRIYLDLANERWEVVEISPSGWRVLADSPVRFRRTRASLPLPAPVASGSVEQLFEFINVPAAADRALVLGWLLAALRPKGPYPILILQGEQGSAKSTTARRLRELVDPIKAGLRSESRNLQDLMIAATNSWVLVLDNVSYLR